MITITISITSTYYYRYCEGCVLTRGCRLKRLPFDVALPPRHLSGSGVCRRAKGTQSLEAGSKIEKSRSVIAHNFFGRGMGMNIYFLFCRISFCQLAFALSLLQAAWSPSGAVPGAGRRRASYLPFSWRFHYYYYYH